MADGYNSKGAADAALGLYVSGYRKVKGPLCDQCGEAPATANSLCARCGEDWISAGDIVVGPAPAEA